MRTFAFIQDPGHGWLRVPKAEFDAMAISDKISDCSYQSDKYVFLEEDVDMGVFMEARETRGIVTKTKPYQNKSRESKIRKYPSYKPAVLTVG
jgi:hypothetical protein